ncbi:flagellar hook assembly protein FlgD [Phenylobacterium sp. LjRoot225]|uniref:flagellar hook assembly protein FlgD n=1 Tax=Phenylobacterium sp. LjRoot225 TaxID=3342285 RepID=UPI003ECEFA7E
MTSATSPISTTTATTTAATTDTTSAGRTRLADNMNMFLTLLTTQMKNQDPTSPMDSNQFMSQLVQMTGVEQQLAGNDLLKQLVANTGTSLSSAVGLIGKEVRASTSDAALSNGQAKWGYSLPANAADVKIEVLDANGVPVRTASGGTDDMKAGEHSFTWDGKDNSGAAQPDGVYTLRVTATDAGAKSVASTIYVQGLVTAIQQEDGAAVITVNGGKVPISLVTSVTQPATETATTTDTTNTADQTSA